MIESLSAAMGLAIDDPIFWMPLVMTALVTVLLWGTVLFDGIALGAGVLMPWLSHPDRLRVLETVKPWQRANERWLPLLLGVSMAAFPLAWSQMIEGLYAPLLMLVASALLRSLAIRGGPNVWIYAAASVVGALGYGLLLAAYATGQRFHWSFVAFDLVMSLSMVAAFALLAVCWLLIKWPADASISRLTRLGAAAARWTAAGMVALSFMLALANPAIFYKWTHSNHLQVAGIWWVVMLVAFVWLDRLLRSWDSTPQAHKAPQRKPLLLTALLLSLMFAGLIYSVFPFLVLDELTIWDASASVEALSVITVIAAVLAAVALCVQLWDYRRLLSGPQPT